MLIVRGDAQTLPSELNKAATGEVWFDPILPKTDGVDVGTVVFSRQRTHGLASARVRVGAPDHLWLRVGLQGRRDPTAGARRRHGLIAPKERHWHGATSTTLMSHTTTTIGATEFHEAVTEAEFAAANATPPRRTPFRDPFAGVFH